MAKFILGYDCDEKEVTDDGRNLTLYNSEADADYNSAEWVTVEANTLEEARLLYEPTFTSWKESAPLKPQD